MSFDQLITINNCKKKKLKSVICVRFGLCENINSPLEDANLYIPDNTEKHKHTRR